MLCRLELGRLALCGLVGHLAFSAEPTIFTDAFNLLLLLGLLV
jgi:hypothetical protein